MRFERKIRASSKIPTASMADIAFLLLIFFMVTTIFKVEEGLSIHLPKAVVGEKVPREKVATIWVDARGRVSIDDLIVKIQDIEPIIAAKMRENPMLIVSFKADEGVQYEIMDRTMEQLKMANALNISFATEEESR
jgi:biopolymer transport protein ExbD